MHGTSMPLGVQGESIFGQLVEAGGRRGVQIRMVENDRPKDVGDNDDGPALRRRGVVDSRPAVSAEYARVVGRRGTMHSKFIAVDRRHFYMGSANLDWRSLTQKMELGVLLLHCPCLAEDIGGIFGKYWELTKKYSSDRAEKSKTTHHNQIARFNKRSPLKIRHEGVEAFVYLASSPRELNEHRRTWDLDSIVHAIDNAKTYCYIHVMDYIPMIVYSQPQTYWPVIDNAIRRAVERGVDVKLLSAALHFVPQTLIFLKSLVSLNSVDKKAQIQVKIFKVPAVTEAHLKFARDRRTHNKFMVTDDTGIIGTSNWSGDYFVGNTGVALVVEQNDTRTRPFISQLRNIFLRDWTSDYAHSLHTYMELCLYGGDPNFCDDVKQFHNV